MTQYLLLDVYCKGEAMVTKGQAVVYESIYE